MVFIRKTLFGQENRSTEQPTDKGQKKQDVALW